MNSFLVFVALISVGCAQVAYHQPIPYALQQVQHVQEIPLAHRVVVENALREAQYPPELVNNFYKNPKIAEALAKESWFGDKEMPVFDRETEKIPRESIIKIFKNAGYIRRR